MRQENQSLHLIVNRFCNSFPSQIEAVLESLDTAPSPSPAFISQLQAELHRMSGAAHCMGFRMVGAELGRIDVELQDLVLAKKSEVRRQLPAIREDLQNVKALMGHLSPHKSKLINRATALEDLESAEQLVTTPAEAMDAKKRLLGREKILIAEDDPHVLELISATFRELGVQDIRVVSNGTEVLNAIGDFEPSFIVTDWEMHPVNGLELLKRIRAGGTSLDPETPIIFFTANKKKSAKREAIRFGANKVMTKPRLPSEIVDGVIEVLGKRYQLNSKPPTTRIH